MALQTSGAISLNDIHVEAGGTSGTTASMNDTDIRNLTAASGRTINSTSNGVTDFSDYYGATSETSLGDSAGSNINGQVQLSQITVSSYISSGGTLRIPSNMWVWSDSTSTAAMTIDIQCTVINDGKIIGKGGQGGNTAFQNISAVTGGAGGPAINVTSSGVTITNSSGAYIAGGGGGGTGHPVYHTSGTYQMGSGGCGGGAGGGAGGKGGARSSSSYSGGSNAAGGVLNATGADGAYENSYTGGSDPYAYNGHGGGAGGGAGGQGGGQIDYAADGGAGGRILPGTGGSGGGAGGSRAVAGTSGGSAGNAGTNNSSYNYNDSQPGYGAAGGGGWGANGGNGYYYSGGAGGAAITGTSRTLSNSGTIYGST